MGSPWLNNSQFQQRNEQSFVRKKVKTIINVFCRTTVLSWMSSTLALLGKQTCHNRKTQADDKLCAFRILFHQNYLMDQISIIFLFFLYFLFGFRLFLPVSAMRSSECHSLFLLSSIFHSASMVLVQIIHHRLVWGRNSKLRTYVNKYLTALAVISFSAADACLNSNNIFFLLQFCTYKECSVIHSNH